MICIPGLYYLCEGHALQYTTSGQAGVISATLPLMIALGARVWLGEPLTRRSLVALGVSLAGVAALSFGGPVETDAPNPLLGNVLELLAMLAAAGSMLTIKRLSSRYDPWLLTGWQSIAGVVFFLPFALLSDPTRWLSAPAMTWLSQGYLGIAVGLGAFGLYNAPLAAWAASRAVQAINLVPAVALAAGWVWRGESLSPLQVAASLVIVGAVVVASTAPERVVRTGWRPSASSVDPLHHPLKAPPRGIMQRMARTQP